MSELSTEVKAKETHERAVGNYSISEQYGYKFLMDVKEIRDEKLFLHLGFSDFSNYCLSNWNYERDYMNERIRIADEFGENYDGVHRSLGHTKSLLLSRMPEEQREQVTTKGIPTDAGYKPVDEATQKEINDYKRNAEEAEKKARQAEQSKQQAETQAESERKERERLEDELNSQEPKIKEIVKEVDNTDYKKIGELERAKGKAEEEIRLIKQELEDVKDNGQELEKLKEDLSKLYETKDDLLAGISVAKLVGEASSNINFCSESINNLMQPNIMEEIVNSPSLIESLEKEMKNLKEIMNNYDTYINRENNSNNIIDAKII